MAIVGAGQLTNGLHNGLEAQILGSRRRAIPSTPTVCSIGWRVRANTVALFLHLIAASSSPPHGPTFLLNTSPTFPKHENAPFLASSARSEAFLYFKRKGSSRDFEEACNKLGVLFCWDQIKFAGSFFVEQRALFLVSTTPMLVSSGNTYEIPRGYTLLTGVVLV